MNGCRPALDRLPLGFTRGLASFLEQLLQGKAVKSVQSRLIPPLPVLPLRVVCPRESLFLLVVGLPVPSEYHKGTPLGLRKGCICSSIAWPRHGLRRENRLIAIILHNTPIVEIEEDSLLIGSSDESEPSLREISFNDTDLRHGCPFTGCLDTET